MKALNSIWEIQGNIAVNPGQVSPQRIKFLTMHGAKGLDANVVFIPGLEQGILPHRRAFQAAGLMAEQRRLLYVSITRAKAVCILSLAETRTGSQAQRLGRKWSIRQAPSQFLNDIGIPAPFRTGGLSSSELSQAMTDIKNM